MTDVRRADGQGPAFAPRIAIVPEGLALDSGEEGTLQVTLQLDERDYDADTLHVGSLYLTGDGNLRVEVKLRVTAATHSDWQRKVWEVRQRSAATAQLQPDRRSGQMGEPHRSQ